jgi:hypothetical protein
MPKAIKGNAGRKPPEPAANHSDIDDWFRRQMPHLQPIVKRLDETIRALIPGLHYALRTGFWRTVLASTPGLWGYRGGAGMGGHYWDEELPASCSGNRSDWGTARPLAGKGSRDRQARIF